MSDYSDKLKSPKWQRRRLEIMKRDKFKCKKCGDEETMLNVHHKIYKKDVEPWEYKNSELVTLCKDCHDAVESMKKIQKDHPGCSITEFDDISIYKINLSPTVGRKVMFIRWDNIVTITSFCKDGHEGGMVLEQSHIQNVINIFKKAL